MAGTVTAPTPEQIPLHLDRVPGPPPRRPRMLLVAASFAAAGSVAVFVGLLGVYLSVRTQFVADNDTWLPDGAEIPLSPGNMGMITLLMSLVTVQWAVHAARNRDRAHTYLALGVTILVFGLAHVTLIGYLWTQWGLPLNGADGTTPQAVLLFTILGLHIAMVFAGLLFLTLMAIRTLGGQFTGRDAEGLSAAALYWYVTVAVYGVLWYALLIVK
ncbi:MAG: cytochrome c oxidase subunit 3 [Acidimicrobiales bacterium]